MRGSGLDEQDAFRRLHELANEKSRKLIDVAQMILVAEGLCSRASGQG
jgi:AmiR/NasT family two-component response regulator